MLNCYTAAKSKEIDEILLAAPDAPSLMEKAGQALWDTVCARWPTCSSIGILCGPGNNGGDGYVLGRLAQAAGVKVKVFAYATPKKQALRAQEAFCQAGGQLSTVDEAISCELIVDALLGTGLSTSIKGELADIIGKINHGAAPVLCVDIPSGLCADTGARLGHAVNAEVTVTFITHKQGLYTGHGPDQIGTLVFNALGTEEAQFNQVSPSAFATGFSDVQHWCHPRKRSTHKGACGHVLIVGGAPGMTGAAVLSAIAALRAGAGKVTIATHPEHAPFLNIHQPELMICSLESVEALEAAAQAADVMVLGPGLGQSSWSEQVYQACITKSIPKVIDADALNWMAKLGIVQNEMHILTPHPGEAGRLLSQTSNQIQQNRFKALEQLVTLTNGVVVLKGCGTLVSSPNLATHICTQGNPGMATAGTGDVLSGAIASLWAQGISPERSALLGVCLHANAADMAALNGERGLIASDIFPFMRALLGK